MSKVTTEPRQSGKTQTEEVAETESDKNDALPGEGKEEPTFTTRQSRFRTPGLSRMRFDWRGEDGMAVARARDIVNERLQHNFDDAFEILFRLWDIVRIPLVNTDGEAIMGDDGLPEYQRTVTGGYVEDFSKLARAERENFLFEITTRIFGWKQRAADAWAEAMFAKTDWEERFSYHFDIPSSGTIEDRTAVGRLEARDERYFSVFVTYYSKKCDALVYSMEQLRDRLRDTLV